MAYIVDQNTIHSDPPMCDVAYGKRVDAIPDGLRIIDEKYNMLLVNRTFREQTGCADKSWGGEKCYKAAHDLDGPTDDPTCG